MLQLLQAIRDAMEKDGRSRYRIAKDTGISQAHLSRLASGEAGLSIETLELLADDLGLEITIRPKKHRKRKGGRS